MQNKIRVFFQDKEPVQANSGSLNSPEIYITDRTEEASGGIVIQRIPDYNIKGVKIENPPLLDIFHYTFIEYSFKKEIIDENNRIIGFPPVNSGDSYRHCECILFPHINNEESWILLIETKYARDLKAASKIQSDYPHSMIEQIISTAEYLRRHGIIPSTQKIDAIVSFPNLIIDYQSTLFKGKVYRENNNRIDVRKAVSNQDMTITQIAKKYKIRIKAQNTVTVNNETRLSFT